LTQLLGRGCFTDLITQKLCVLHPVRTVIFGITDSYTIVLKRFACALEPS
jgi:hypothetical protein